MRIHVLGFPHTETTQEWSACAYTSRTADFCSMMTLAGHEVHLYAGERNEARVARHFPIVTRQMQRAWYPDFDRTRVFNDFDTEKFPWRVFNQRAADAIKSNSEPGDVLAVTMGVCHRPCATSLPGLLHVETGVGYSGVWAPYRVFESAAWRHYLAAREKTDDLRWFDEVIPRGYFPAQFPAGDRPGVDFLFLGRLTARKGPQVAAQACQRLGARLLVAGQGAKEYKNGEYILTDEGVRLEGNVHYLGILKPDERAAALGAVRAVFMPTYYLEPGGGVAIEAQMCGTPVITTPWGAMTETVLEGRTGYHCSTLAEFVAAADAAGNLDRAAIRKSAVSRFSAGVIADRYSKYFRRLSTLSGEGWYAV